MDQPKNTSKNLLHVLNGARSKTKANIERGIECIDFEGFDQVRIERSIGLSRGGRSTSYPRVSLKHSNTLTPFV